MKRKWNRREFSKSAALQLGMTSLPSILGGAVKGGKSSSKATIRQASFPHSPPRKGIGKSLGPKDYRSTTWFTSRRLEILRWGCRSAVVIWGRWSGLRIGNSSWQSTRVILGTIASLGHSTIGDCRRRRITPPYATPPSW
jgi:hypothetical protein